jgi:hypothetical protein
MGKNVLILWLASKLEFFVNVKETTGEYMNWKQLNFSLAQYSSTSPIMFLSEVFIFMKLDQKTLVKSEIGCKEWS